MYDTYLEVFTTGFLGGFMICLIAHLIGFAWWSCAGILKRGIR